MNFVVFVLAVSLAVVSAQFGGFGQSRQFKPQSFAKTNRPGSANVAKATADDRSASIVKYENNVEPDGSYSFNFETDNGIAAQENGVPRNLGGNPPVIPVVKQGSFSWISPENQPIVISYIADENGYQPEGDALPTPPPVPPQIARALEWIAKNAPRQ